MGESFKLHAQALTGYEDALLSQETGSHNHLMPMHGAAVAAY